MTAAPSTPHWGHTPSSPRQCSDNSADLKPNSPAASNILVRGTNWVGDAIMTLPALSALAASYPDSRLTVLARPWAMGVYQGQPGVSAVTSLAADGVHRGLFGRLRLARELAGQHYDLAVLFQNAFEAAFITALARIPERWGYARDGRGFLLTKPVKVEPADLLVHESFYYLNILERAGLNAPFTRPRLRPHPEAVREARAALFRQGEKPGDFLLALAPGASFGSAKRWPVENFALAARLILDQLSPPVRARARVMILGGPGEIEAAYALDKLLPGPGTLNLAGRTSLMVAMALLNRASLLLTNDSGLMHLGGALDVPLVAVFGPTNPRTTAPLGLSRLIRSKASCAPCLKRECPLDRRICFDDVTAEAVAAAGLELINSPAPDPDFTPAVFLDRDGTINQEVDFLSRPDQLRLTPGAGRAIAALNRAGFKVVVATNQSGLARGLFSPEDLEQIHQRLRELVAEEGGRIDAFYFCPHHPSEGVVAEWTKPCQCRKPAPGLFSAACAEMKLDPAASFWVGDRWRDLEMAASFGGRSVLVLTGYGLAEAKKPEIEPTLVAPDLRRAAEWIVSLADQPRDRQS